MAEMTRHYSAKDLNVHDLLSHLTSWFAKKDFEVQTLKTEDGADLVQVAKRGKWRKFVGLSAALNVVLRVKDSDLTVEIGTGKWLDKAATGTVSLFILWPLAVSTAFGAWQQMKLPERTFSAIGEYIRSPRSVKVVLDPALEEVQAATEKVNVPQGVTAKVKRSRTIEHAVSLITSESTETTSVVALREFLSQSIKKEIEQKHGCNYRESETLEYEVTLDGSRGGSYTLVWVDSFCSGIVEFAQANEIQRVPFRFRTQTDLQVTPG